MSFSRKLGLAALVVSLLGVGVGTGIALGSSTHVAAVEAPGAVVLERRELDSVREPGERAMVTTRPSSSAPSSPVLGAVREASARDASTREAQRLPSLPVVREATERRVDGSRAAEGLRIRRLAVAAGIEAR